MKRWLLDTLERTVATYVQSLLGLLIASPMMNLDLSTVRALAVAALPAALAVVKAALASRVHSMSPASLMPERGSDAVESGT